LRAQLYGATLLRVTTKAEVARELQSSVQDFVRAFGLLVTKQTPCGQPVSPSIAHALMALLDRAEAGVDTYQHELADLLGLDRSSITRLCSRLEREGRLEQAPGVDGRTRQLRLTTSGQKVAKNLRDASRARFARIVLAIPAAKRQTLLDSLTLLTSAVRALENEP
jgi:DNA-binding MarR family transcriptional regulator